MSFLADILGITEIREGHKFFGAGRFWALVAATLAWLSVGAGLAIALDYPQSYGSSCQRKCAIEIYWHTGALLRDGSWPAIALFVWTWSLPTIGIVVVTWSWINHFRRKHANRIHWSE